MGRLEPAGRPPGGPNGRDQQGNPLCRPYDLNAVPADLKARVLTTNIDLHEGGCSRDL
nr:hypothetical protein [Acidiferrobacter sp.]